LINQTLKAMFGESSSPASDQTSCRVQPPGDLRVSQTAGGVQHDPGALHLLERELLSPRDTLKLATL
jgi:hypothetical protein